MKFNSSKLSWSKTRKKAGFSLAELLMVVIIIGILAAFTGVAAVSMYKNMKQTQLDKVAETIFYAAQNRLSEIYAYGNEDDVGPAKNDDLGVIDADKQVFYVAKDDGGNFTGADAANLILSKDSVDGEVYNGLWAIEYQASTCRVLNVVFTNKDGLGGFGKGINGETALATMVADLKNHDFSGRKDKYGWYGNGTISDLAKFDNEVGNTSVNVEIVNEENLYAHLKATISWDEDLPDTKVADLLTKVKLKLTIKADDGSSSKDYTIAGNVLSDAAQLNGKKTDYFYFANAKVVKNDDNVTATWDVLLDTLAANAFNGSNDLFKFRNNGTGITAGNDFVLVLETEENTSGTDVIVPKVLDYDISNSLFAHKAGSTVYVEYGRHLQNLANAAIGDMDVVQVSDLDFNSDNGSAPGDYSGNSGALDELNKHWLSVYPDDGSGNTSYEAVTPKSGSTILSYDGQGYTITNLDVGAATSNAAGIFGNLTGTTSVNNLKIEKCAIKIAVENAGMFAGKITADTAFENVSVKEINVDTTGIAGGLVGQITGNPTIETGNYFEGITIRTSGQAAGILGLVGGQPTIKDTPVVGVKISAAAGETALPESAGTLIGKATGAATIENVQVAGSEINARTTAGGLVGDAILASSIKNSFTIGSTVSASAGATGGLVGRAGAALSIEKAAVYMPGTDDSAKAFATIEKQPATFDTVSQKKGSAAGAQPYFKYLNELKAGKTANDLIWINGTVSAGGLVGDSVSDVTIKDSFAASVISAGSGTAGGLVGNSAGKLDVTSSYADSYIKGSVVGGMAGSCAASSTFNGCYTAGFLMGTATSAAGFVPGAVSVIDNSYTVFDFDDVNDTTLFSGTSATATEDDDHKLNEYGTVANYPDITDHDTYYAVAQSVGSGKSYYTYSKLTTNDSTSTNFIKVTGAELAARHIDATAEDILGTGFAAGGAQTSPYVLSAFFGTLLNTYPYPNINSADGAFKHYNDWLTNDDAGEFEVEIYYMMYNENLTALRTNVTGFGGEGIKLLGKTKAVPIDNNGEVEYQINVKKRDTFGGYKFVGYFDPMSAAAPLLDSSVSFDRAQKLDYLAADSAEVATSIKNDYAAGDRIVKTSIYTANRYNTISANHGSIVVENPANEYQATKRLYAVYRYDKPYLVTLSYVEYELPEPDETSESLSLEEIYHGSRLADKEPYEIAYTEPGRDAVADLASDEELTDDYLAEKLLYDRYKNGELSKSQYNDEIVALNERRAAVNQQINVNIPDFSENGYDLLDFDRLKDENIISSDYCQFVKNMPVYRIVRIDPATKDVDGEDLEYKDRCQELEATTDNKLNMTTEKAYEYVIMYSSNSARQTLKLVFRNTHSEDTTVSVVKNYKNLCDKLEDLSYSSERTDTYTVRVSTSGFTDTYETLAELMSPDGYPEFTGFELNRNDVTDVQNDSGKRTVTLYYDRRKFVLSFRLNDPDDGSTEYYKTQTYRDDIGGIMYGQPYEHYLWEVANSNIRVTVSNNSSLLNSNSIEVGVRKGNGWNSHYNWTMLGNYEALENYIRALPGNTGTIRLRTYTSFWGSDSADHTWTKEDGELVYAFNRSGYFLSGFKYYYQADDGDVSFNGEKYEYVGEVSSIMNTLYMPGCDVLVEPVWTENPKHLRIEVYYQTPYDDIAAKDENIEYEFFKSKTYDVVNGVATLGGNRRITTSALVASVSASNTGLVDYLETYAKAGDIPLKSEHGINGGFNPYISNAGNTKRFGYPHDAGNDTMVVALYYDRAPVTFKFHFITADNYSFNSGGTKYIRSQWNDFIANSSLYNYSGSLEDHIALRNELRSPNAAGDYVTVGRYARVKVSSSSQTAVASTNIQYGGLSRNGDNYTTTDSLNNIAYGKTIYYQALYGAPTVFSSDNTSLLPKWYYYMDTDDPPIETMQYIIGGSSAGTTTYFNEFSLQYFGDVSTATSSLSKDLYPYYADRNVGYTIMYIEASPSDNSGLPTRTNYNQNVNANMFITNPPAFRTYGRTTNTSLVLQLNGSIRKFIDGYTTYGYKWDTGNINTNIPETISNNNSTNVYLYLKRDTYDIRFIDATLNTTSTFKTKRLYKEQIDKLPGKDELIGPGSDYVFDGWYTSSAFTTRIADADGNIDSDYLNLTTTLKDANGHLLMNYQTWDIFAKWAPRNCNITFNPFYPDALDYGVDARLTIDTNPVPYGSTIGTLPNPQSPAGSVYANRSVIEEDGNLYYVVKNTEGEELFKYKFLGWYTYTGLDTPSQMSDLQKAFVPGVTKVTNHTVLYAKWEQTFGSAIYTIICYDYTDNGNEIFRVRRTGVAGSSVILYPPRSDDDQSHDVDTQGDYEDLRDYEPLSTYMRVTITNGSTFRFRYKKASDWTIVKRNVVVDDAGNDILINTTQEQTTYSQKQVVTDDITGYSIYEYQIGDGTPVAKTTTSGYISVPRPAGAHDTVTVTVRYKLNNNQVRIGGSSTYYKYDRLSIMSYQDVFNWADITYKPVVRYEVGGVTAYEFIGASADDTVNRAVDEAISELANGDYSVTLTLMAYNISTSTYTGIPIADGSSTIGVVNPLSILASSYRLYFDNAKTINIYYAYQGNNAGKWFWDIKLANEIGPDGTSVPDAATDALTGDVATNAAALKQLLQDNYDENSGQYKAFFIIDGTDAYTVVDNYGNLRNGARIGGEKQAFVEKRTGSGTKYKIRLYDSNGNLIDEIEVYLP